MEPMRLIFGNRATSEYKGKHIDVAEITKSVPKKWIGTNLRYVDPDQHILFQNEFKTGSAELTGIFERIVMCANDTSAAVAYAPQTDTERLVLSTERHMNSVDLKKSFLR